MAVFAPWNSHKHFVSTVVCVIAHGLCCKPIAVLFVLKSSGNWPADHIPNSSSPYNHPAWKRLQLLKKIISHAHEPSVNKSLLSDRTAMTQSDMMQQYNRAAVSIILKEAVHDPFHRSECPAVHVWHDFALERLPNLHAIRCGLGCAPVPSCHAISVQQ